MKTFRKVNGDRVYDKILELANIGKIGETGTHRFALTDIDKEAHKLVTSWMKEAGMQVRYDNFGNLIGRKEGQNPDYPVVMIGSHIDTVPNGGRFDGVIGVLGGIEVVQCITEDNIPHEYPIEVVAFCDEEGSRFSDGLFGSRGMVGLVNERHLDIKDEDGISRYEALKSFDNSIDPDQIEKSVNKTGDIKYFLEMHIEQGPYLEEYNAPVGIVEGIAGPAWLKIRINGEAGHAGTTPMNLRKDPMIGASEIIQQIDLISKSDSTNTLVGTVGKIEASPGGRNVIPDSVEFTLDLRDMDLERRNQSLQRIEEEIQKVCEKRKLSATIERLQEIDPVPCSSEVITALQESSEELGLNAPIMVSGAGHDAMFIAQIAEIGMIFVRSKNGISHNPTEWSSKEDIEKGTELLSQVIHKLI